jgi:hypothetical protein
LALFLWLCVAAHGKGLHDDHIVGSSTTYLDGKWTATSAAVTISASVPGDLLTDLQQAGRIADPLHELNFLNSSEWSKDWTYHREFTLTDATSLLVFDGIKMEATVSVDGKVLGMVDDQFLRYVFPLPKGTGAGTHTVTVEFKNECSAELGGRWMAATGGWVRSYVACMLPVSASCRILMLPVCVVLFAGLGPVLPYRFPRRQHVL